MDERDGRSSPDETRQKRHATNRRLDVGEDDSSGIRYVTAEGIAFVKQAEDAASNKKAFVRKIIELHDKYLAYVNGCFQNHSLFHKALKEAFEVFCNKDVTGSSSAELLASFCDHILKDGGREKLSDEAIEETLEKVTDLTLGREKQADVEEYLSTTP